MIGQILFTVDTKDLEMKRTESKERFEQVKIYLSNAVTQKSFSQKGIPSFFLTNLFLQKKNFLNIFIVFLLS